ncbi:hypothetical protein DMX11_19485 [Pseudomonas sp. LB-090624]|nr:hypothetical protein DMX11_19485 [Pseudomonas sp. LB-090624]
MLGGLGGEKEFALAGLGGHGQQQKQGEQQSEHAGSPGNRWSILRGTSPLPEACGSGLAPRMGCKAAPCTQLPFTA